jgi:predicted transcriptional regulator
MPTRKHIAKAVKAYAQRNGLAAEHIPAVAAAVHAALFALERGTHLDLAEQLVPTVPIKRAIRQSKRAKAVGLGQRVKEAGIIGGRAAPTNIIDRAVVRLASETQLRGILARS